MASIASSTHASSVDGSNASKTYDDSSFDSIESSPHYLKATSCSQGKKTGSLAHNIKSLQTLPRPSSLRNPRILVKNVSLKTKRATSNHPMLPEDVKVTRATFSSTVKGSKCPKPVEARPVGVESKKCLDTKSCRYHHCSLHDSVSPSKSYQHKKEKSSNVRNHLPGNHLPKKENGSFGHEKILGLDIAELAFGETSFPERSYRENIEIFKKYSDFGRESGGTTCSRCSRACVDLSSDEPIFSSLDNNNGDAPSHGSGDADAVEISVEKISDFTGDFDVTGERAVGVDKSEPNSEGGELRFSEQKHISMWHLIRQNMAANSVVGPTEVPIGDEGTGNTVDDDNGSENQEIELRKMFAIKLVREAIEKILLPEVQDQTSDDQSVTSESTPRKKLFEWDQIRAITERNHTEHDAAHNGEGDASSNHNQEDPISVDACCSREIKNTEIEAVKKSEKKAPKHWSNLKRWIVLQRFIGELEKVRKINLKQPQLETEKVHLRHQASDGRKSTEEWMLDYALRQAVGQLAPTQKKKVALLVKAFETVAPTRDDGCQGPCRIIPRLRSDGDGISVFNSAIRESESEIITKTEKLRCSKDSGGGESKDSKLTEKNWEAVTGYFLPSNGNADIEDPEVGEVKLEKITTVKAMNCDSRQYIQTDKKRHIKMWHLIYQHVVSGIAEKVGARLLDGEDDDEQEDYAPSGDDYSTVNDQESSGFTQSDALKLVQEAVDEILSHEIRDDASDTDTQSISDIDSVSEIGETGNRTMQPRRSNSWSTLKRLVVLKRSIKALEKNRKEAKPTSANMVERGKAEQWMLDYAVQHIVTKLGPSRKRRVAMLVEAFEAIVPMPEM